MNPDNSHKYYANQQPQCRKWVGLAITGKAGTVMFGLGKQQAPQQAPTLPSNLANEQGRFQAIFNNIEDGVILVDTEQTIQMLNPGAATICGWAVNDATGISVQQVMRFVDDKGEALPPEKYPFTLIMQQSKTVHDNKAVIVNRENKQVPISLTISPLVGEEGQLIAAVAVFRNVSAERAEEQQRADFISTASHEMRTPVAAIEGYLALALNDKVSTIDNRARGYLEKAHASTKHLGQLFQDLLTSAKAEDGRLANHPSVVEMGAFMEQLGNDLRFAAEKKGLVMEFRTGAANQQSTINATRSAGGERVVRPLFNVYADPDRLREVITNLFDNAVKYTPEGKVTLGITGDDQVVQCYVSDTGPGIPAEDLPHLFQKFYRVDNSATRTIGGTGLGLFICRKIIEMYGGRIWVESTLGKGSTFYINLPRLSNDKATELQQAAAANPELAPINSLAQP